MFRSSADFFLTEMFEFFIKHYVKKYFRNYLFVPWEDGQFGHGLQVRGGIQCCHRALEAGHLQESGDITVRGSLFERRNQGLGRRRQGCREFPELCREVETIAPAAGARRRAVG